MFGVGAVAPGRGCDNPDGAAGAPHIPASLLALAMLARSGPFVAFFVCTPAFVLAEDHKDPKASPPVGAFVLAVGLPSVAALVDDVKDG